VVKKRPASSSAQKVLKKPAIIEADADESSSEDVETEVPKPVLRVAESFFRYSQPYKYPNGVIAIRRAMKDTKKQVASAKGKDMLEEELYSVMKELSTLLSNGQVSEEDAKSWLKERVY
jgi:hypothetical protein